MNFSITISLGRMFCWKWKERNGEKIQLRSFMQTEQCKIIKEAVRKGFEKKTITEDYLKTKIRNYLDGCKDSGKKIPNQKK